MRTVVSVCRVATALGALSLLGVAGPLPAADPEPFEAVGVVLITSVEGDALMADVAGESSPGGEFRGTLDERLVGFGAAAVGTVTYVYENGSLTFFFVDGVNANGRIEGAWNILEGTGAFAGATGGGEFTGWFLDATTAVFALSGTIVR